MMKRTYLLLFAALFIPNLANATQILTSIKPIQMIAFELTKDVTIPDVLLGPNTSPHDYALRPSDIKRIHQADLLIWFGPELEPFLTKAVEKQPNRLTLSSIPDLALREFGHEAHDHDGHHHGSHDPHFWLGSETTLQVANAITEKLKAIDPANAEIYQKNNTDFATNLAANKTQIANKLAPVKSEGYYVFHDAYGYFEQDYGLNHLGEFTVSPERKPGAKKLITIRKSLAENQAKCVFSEPQFTPAVIDSVLRGSQAHKGVLDPIGANIPLENGSYFLLLDQLASSFLVCLSQ